MKVRKIRIIAFFAVFLFACGCGRSGVDTSSFQEGDLIFQNKKIKSQDFLVFLSGSQYNNVGILHSTNGKWYVLEAVQPVQLTPVASWIKEGQGDGYVVKRVADADLVFTKEALEKMKKLRKDFMGSAYDSQYEWSDKSLYPAELVWKMYERALGVELCGLETLADFDLAEETVKQKIKEVYGSRVPLYEELVTVKSIYNSAQLITVVEK